ncbi:hypothetical protein [Actinomyces provencensis]|uniref:hypothetical protein n=1 Tax=Actinomyces provencensis TaxID=1720198 RepID=UPI0011776603|nr:hypothetical protein [Actinomyces provencensis]
MFATLAIGLFSLTACTQGVDGQADNSGHTAGDPLVSAVDRHAQCPESTLEGFRSNGDNVVEDDVSAIEKSISVKLPGEPACVLTSDWSSVGSTSFYVFWADYDESFVDTVGGAFSDAGYAIAPDGRSYSGGGTSVTIASFAAGDPNWTGDFGGDALVVLTGSFDGHPGTEASIKGKVSLNWEDACLLSLEEVNEVWQSSGYTFETVEPAGDDQTGCAYSTIATEHVQVQVTSYSSTGMFGWAADTQWAAPDQEAAATNACNAASSVDPYLGELQAVCETIHGVPTVIAADRLDALVFMPGDYFYAVGVFGIGGTDSLRVPLADTATLLSSRQPDGG